MDIPVHAKVFCQQHECGKIVCVIIHPIHKEVTHIVVQENGLSGIERLVPVDYILNSQNDRVVLRCPQSEFEKFEPFTKGHYIMGEEPYLNYETGRYYYPPLIVPGYDGVADYIPLIEQIELIPPGELGIHRGAEVFATDGRIGKVDEFLISPNDDKISHLVLREGHLWGEKDVTIPVSEIDRIETDRVYIKLSKQAVGELPSIPVKRFFE